MIKPSKLISALTRYHGIFAYFSSEREIFGQAADEGPLCSFLDVFQV